MKFNTVIMFVLMALVTLSIPAKSESIPNALLLSYDILEINEAENYIDLWLRYRINYDHKSVTILNIDHVLEDCKDLDSFVIGRWFLSDPDPQLLNYHYERLRIDHDAIDLIPILLKENAGYLSICLQDQEGNIDNVNAKIQSDNVQRISITDRSFKIEFDSFEYERVNISKEDLLLYPLLQHCVDDQAEHEKEYYWIKLYGTESKHSSNIPIIGVNFYSDSRNLYLEPYGNSLYTIHEWCNAYDLLYDREKEIAIEGLMVMDDNAPIGEAVSVIEAHATYSSEYAGNYDISDAGDRFHGPRFVSDIAVAISITNDD